MKVLAVCAALLVAVVLAAPVSHKIKSLPGAPAVSFSQYSGYVNIDAAHNKNLFYWFVESQRDPKNDPVVFWMNGGPGSSSFLGLLIEHGPFRPNADGKTLFANPFAWNRVANIIYVETPIGVGFSYSDVPSDLTTGDDMTASDNYKFIVEWLKLYPEFAKHDFYVAGESYGGHYVPELVLEILRRDTAKNIKLSGMLIGNPATNTDFYQQPGTAVDTNMNAWNYLTFVYSHGLLPHEQYRNAVAKCGWEDFLSQCDVEKFKHPSAECSDAVQVCLDVIPIDVDVYDLNAPVCLDPSLDYTASWNPFTRFIQERRRKAGMLRDDSMTFEPCIFNFVTAYMNNKDVQEALHGRSVQWVPTSQTLNFSLSDQRIDMTKLYPDIFRRSNIRSLVFSGDFDAAVPFLETQKWISCLGRPVKSGWRSWHMDGQVAGGVIEYDKISFLTIKGAGHAVPYYNPAQGFEFFQRWMDKQPF